MEMSWRQFSEKSNLLDELKFWQDRNREWKWVIKTKLVRFKHFIL